MSVSSLPVPLVLFIAAASPAMAQGETLPDLVDRSLSAMHDEKWRAALELHQQAISRFGNRALETYGPRFGALFYRKGLCEMQLKQWDDACASFQTCYQDFSNDASPPGRENAFQKLALLRWGESAMAARKWELALSCFEKFLHERDRQRDLFQQATFYISRAVCNYELGRLAEGNENLETAINNKKEFETPDSAILAGFQGLVKAAIAKREERTLLDFIRKNHSALMVPPLVRWRDVQAYLKLAGDALAAGMPAAARELYAFAPTSAEALADAEGRLTGLPPGADRGALTTETEQIRRAASAPDSPDVIRLSGMACLHESTGALRDALEIYQALEAEHPRASRRESHLLSLIRIAGQLGESAMVRNAAETFLRDFAQSTHANEVEKRLAESQMVK